MKKSVASLTSDQLKMAYYQAIKEPMPEPLYSGYDLLKDWSTIGELIEKNRISITVDSSGVWIAYIAYNYSDEQEFMQSGTNPIEAALRCFIYSKLGYHIELGETNAQTI